MAGIAPPPSRLGRCQKRPSIHLHNREPYRDCVLRTAHHLTLIPYAQPGRVVSLCELASASPVNAYFATLVCVGTFAPFCGGLRRS